MPDKSANKKTSDNMTDLDLFLDHLRNRGWVRIFCDKDGNVQYHTFWLFNENIRPFSDIDGIVKSYFDEIKRWCDEIFKEIILTGTRSKRNRPSKITAKLLPDYWVFKKGINRKRYFLQEDFVIKGVLKNGGENYENMRMNAWLKWLESEHKIKYNQKNISQLSSKQQKAIKKLNNEYVNMELFAYSLVRGENILKMRIRSGLFPLPYDFYVFKSPDGKNYIDNPNGDNYPHLSPKLEKFEEKQWGALKNEIDDLLANKYNCHHNQTVPKSTKLKIHNDLKEKGMDIPDSELRAIFSDLGFTKERKKEKQF